MIMQNFFDAFKLKFLTPFFHRRACLTKQFVLENDKSSIKFIKNDILSIFKNYFGRHCFLISQFRFHCLCFRPEVQYFPETNFHNY